MASVGLVRQWARPAGVLAIALACGGCLRPAGEAFAPARGQVLVGNNPAEGAVVTLVPAGGGPADPDAKATGRVGADGWFTLTTYTAGTRTVHDGARPGTYTVLISWVPGPTREGLARGTPEPDRLGGRYQTPGRSPWRVEIPAGGTELPPIRLKASEVVKAADQGGKH